MLNLSWRSRCRILRRQVAAEGSGIAAIIVAFFATLPAYAQSRPDLVLHEGHVQDVQSVLFSRSGRILATASDDVCLWTAQNPSELRRIDAVTGQVIAIAFSSDEETMITGDRAGFVRIWSTRTGRERLPGPHFTSPVQAVAMMPGGELVVAVTAERSAFAHGSEVAFDGVAADRAGDAELHVIHLESGIEISSWTLDRFAGLIPWNDDIVITDVKDAPVGWDLSTSERADLRSAAPAVDRPVAAFPSRIWLSGDSGEFAVLEDRNSDLFLRFVESSERLDEERRSEVWLNPWRPVSETKGDQSRTRIVGVEAIVPDPDLETVLVAYNDRSVRLLDLATGREIGRFDTAVRRIDAQQTSSVAFSSVEDAVLLGGPGGRVELWDRTTESTQAYLTSTFPVVNAAQFAPDGTSIAVVDEQGVFSKWNLVDGIQTTTYGIHRRDEVFDAIHERFAVPRMTFDNPGSGGEYHLDLIAPIGDPETRTMHIRRHNHSMVVQAPLPTLRPIWFGSDGRTLVVERTQSFEALTGRRIALQDSVPANETLVAAAPGSDGRFALLTDRTVRLVQVSFDSRQVSESEPIPISKFEDTAPDDVWSKIERESPKEPPASLRLSHDGKTLAIAYAEQPLQFWDLENGRSIDRPEPFAFPPGGALAFHPSEQLWATALSSNAIRLWGPEREQTFLVGHKGRITDVSFSPDGRLLLTASEDRTVRLWDWRGEAELARLVRSPDGRWMVLRFDGQFDTNNIEGVRGLHWVFADDPFRALPPEIFLRDYYEPNLLARLLAGEEIPAPAKDFSQLNRVQPEVADPTVEVAGDVARVKVRVRATGTRDAFGVGDARRDRVTDAFDLRLFRDGQLVWRHPTPKQEGDGELTVTTDAWRDANRVIPNVADGWYERTVEVPLAHNRPGEAAEFSVYCFNEDRVKSRTATVSTEALNLEPVKPRVYLVGFGADAFETPELDLRYASHDAEVLVAALAKRFPEHEVERTILTSTFAPGDWRKGKPVLKRATERNLQGTLDALAGRPVDPQALAEVPELKDLPACRPDDVVVLLFSSHGYTDPKTGQFHLLPYDTGKREWTPEKAEESLQAMIEEGRTVTASELSRWLLGIDAGETILVLDTCMSEASVQAGEFKPGPFGSRGLGQLAYDRAMQVLVASRTDQAALERGDLQHGLLAYALLEGLGESYEGQKPQAAVDGRLTATGWLGYASERVPQLYGELRTNTFRPRGLAPDAVLGEDQETTWKEWSDEAKQDLWQQKWPALNQAFELQRPQLFDFRKRKQELDLRMAN